MFHKYFFLLNLVTFFKIFCSKLTKETTSILNPLTTSHGITFAVDFTISKDLFNLKNDILTIELQQRQLDIFQRALLYICITWSTILVLKVVPIVAKQYLWRGFTFFYQKPIKFPNIFKEVKTKRYLFFTHLTPNRIYIFCIF